MEVRSGLDANGTLHGVFCGTELPESITSTGNTLRVVFGTDNSVQKRGFAAEFFTGTYTCSSVVDRVLGRRCSGLGFQCGVLLMGYLVISFITTTANINNFTNKADMY